MVERIRSSIGANPGLVLIEKFTNLKKVTYQIFKYFKHQSFYFSLVNPISLYILIL